MWIYGPYQRFVYLDIFYDEYVFSGPSRSLPLYSSIIFLDQKTILFVKLSRAIKKNRVSSTQSFN